MSSLALYRRYRPETFAEVIGQEHVTGPLQQALRNNRVNHAYLFSGPRGCGKTTSARILARCLNCEQGPTPTPCGVCNSCRDLARNGPGSIDVIEIDAASHGGVDDARELREKAFFGPAGSRYKIYIIDEAHMVTSAGFNALLKVVEEPPEHLKFIFATTEPEKVIGTVRSRTHHYPFRLVPPGTLREYLGEVCGREAIPVEDGVLPLVVRAGAGSVRDSMSVMDQLLAGAAEDGVTYAMATSLLGYTDGSLLDGVVEAFASGDGSAAFEVVDRVIEGGNDPRRFVADLLERLRDLVILAAVPDAAEKGLIDAPVEVVERMQAQASVFGAAELSRAADLVNTGLTEMRGVTSPRLQLELICARVLLPAAFDDERSVQARLDRLERGAGAGSRPTGTGPAPVGYVPGPESHLPAGPTAARAATPPVQAEPSSAPGVSADAGPAPAPPLDEAVPPRPGAWPSGAEGGREGQRPGAAPPGRTESGHPQAGGAPARGSATPERRPGDWPLASAAQSAPGNGAPAPQTAQAVSPGVAQGTAQIRQTWPDVLEAVKNRRRFTWILLSQNAHVAGFDGSTLRLSFSNAGARDSFVGGGSEEVLVQALSDALGVHWKIEAIVDPSGGAGGAPASQDNSGFGGAQTSTLQSAPPPAPPPGSSAAPPAPSSPGGAHSGHQAAPPAAPSQPDREQEPPRFSGTADTVAPTGGGRLAGLGSDLHGTSLNGHDLIMGELGATVIEEFTPGAAPDAR